MIKNLPWPALAACALAACAPRGPTGYQGLIAYDERDLAFELGGRLKEVTAKEGDVAAAGAVLARLDDTLDRSALASRRGEAQVAQDELRLLRGGARREDVGAMRARLQAARANEALATTSLARARQLFAGRAITQAALDEAEAQLARARADRAALDENLRALEHGARGEEKDAAQHRLEAAEAAVRTQQERIARHELRALEQAEVLQVHLHAGEIAPAGVPVLTVADTAHPYADVFVPEAQVAGLSIGAAVSGQVDGVPHQVSGRLERIYRRTEYTPRYIFSDSERGNLVARVRVRLDDADRLLHAGIPIAVVVDRSAR